MDVLYVLGVLFLGVLGVLFVGVCCLSSRSARTHPWLALVCIWLDSVVDTLVCVCGQSARIDRLSATVG